MNENNRKPDSSMLVYMPEPAPDVGHPSPQRQNPEPQVGRPMPGQRQTQQKPGPLYAVTDDRAKVFVLLVVAAAISVLYAVCFSGVHILPQLSFAVFCPVVFLALVKTLKMFGLLRNRRALLYAVPITALALMNGIFTINVYTYGNVIVMHVLFAAFIISAASKTPGDYFNLNGAVKIFVTFFSNWTVLFGVIHSLYANRRKRRRDDKAGRVLLGALCAVPLLLIIGGLLVSADMVFASVVSSLLSVSLNAFTKVDMLFIVSVCAAFIYCTGYIWHAKTVAERQMQAFSAFPADTYVCASFLAMLNALFLFFSVIQVAFLFTGGLMKLPGVMVYSEYAREGFFQLLVVTVINFAVIYALLTLFSGAEEKPALKALIFMLLAFTVILIASSFYRMFMYIGIYAYTPLRLGVITFLVMEVALVAVTAIKLIKPESPFVRRFVITVLVFYIIANVSASGYVSARLNVAMFLSGGVMRWIDVTSSGADGLAVIRPYLESDDYICRGNLIIRRNEQNVPFFFGGEEQIFENIATNLLPCKTNDWQNWSLIEHIGRSKTINANILTFQ